MKIPELLVPAGNLEKLRYAVAYGADAVYIGGQDYNLRSAGANFTLEDMETGLSEAHSKGVKVYITLNIFPHNSDIAGMERFIADIGGMGFDAVIAADPGVIQLIRSKAPELPIHLSTQANTLNTMSARFWEANGVKRIVMARELSLEEIAEIKSCVGCEIEVFVHGAMCISYSGRCLLSSFMSGRDSNRGLCTQPCRWKYSLVEETRPGQYFDIGEDSEGTFIMNSKDLCMIEHLDELIDIGVDSFKIEGRMKSVYYTASTAKAYRSALDALASQDPSQWKFVVRSSVEELDKVSHRPYFTGFYYGYPGKEGQEYTSSKYIRSYEFVGNVLDYDHSLGTALVYVRNRLTAGETVDILNPNLPGFTQTVSEIIDTREESEGDHLSAAHANYIVRIPVSQPVESMSILRRPESEPIAEGGGAP